MKFFKLYRNCCRIGNSIIDCLYPPFCIHCRSFLENQHLQLCSSCFTELGLEETEEHCPTCFMPHNHLHHCPNSPLNGLFACAPTSSIMTTLILSNSAALSSLLFYQYTLLPWATIDAVTITPGNSHVDTLCSTRKRLAQEFSMLSRLPLLPSIHLLQENLSNPFSSLENQEKPQDPRCFVFSKPQQYINKKILIIHDLLRSSLALLDTAHALKQIGALEIYGLCFAYDDRPTGLKNRFESSIQHKL